LGSGPSEDVWAGDIESRFLLRAPGLPHASAVQPMSNRCVHSNIQFLPICLCSLCVAAAYWSPLWFFMMTGHFAEYGSTTRVAHFAFQRKLCLEQLCPIRRPALFLHADRGIAVKLNNSRLGWSVSLLCSGTLLAFKLQASQEAACRLSWQMFLWPSGYWLVASPVSIKHMGDSEAHC
jgi:hypothetical protein